MDERNSKRCLQTRVKVRHRAFHSQLLGACFAVLLLACSGSGSTNGGDSGDSAGNPGGNVEVQAAPVRVLLAPRRPAVARGRPAALQAAASSAGQTSGGNAAGGASGASSSAGNAGSAGRASGGTTGAAGSTQTAGGNGGAPAGGGQAAGGASGAAGSTMERWQRGRRVVGHVLHRCRHHIGAGGGCRGATYSDGTKKDIFFNSLKRSRLQLHPAQDVRRSEGVADGYDQTNGYADLAHTITFGKRIKAAGLGFLLDFFSLQRQLGRPR